MSELFAVALPSVHSLPRRHWEGCFPGEAEGWDYFAAVEEAGLPGFEWVYFAVIKDSRPVLLVPAFVTRYRFASTVQGRWKRLAGLASIRMVALGSPVTETCRIGVAPGLAPAELAAGIDLLLERVARYADDRGIGLVAVKDAPAGCPLHGRALACGFAAVPGLPTAELPLPFADAEGYIASLGAATRKDVRRKLRAVPPDLRIEWRTAIDDVLDRVGALYEETLGRSELTFERLPPAYFRAVLRHLGPRAGCFLYWHGDRLVAFNLVLLDESRLVDKFLGMDAEAARRFNLYVVSWITNVRLCLERGLANYCSGQAGYGVKRRLGSRFSGNFLMFRHRNPMLNLLLRGAGRLLRPDNFDADLAHAVEAGGGA
jgi:hypothetical protein